MKNTILLFLLFTVMIFNQNCSNQSLGSNKKIASEILGNPDYLAFSFGGYRHLSRDTVPTVEELKEDLAILAAMNIKLLRTYNTQQFAHASNLLKAISELKMENPDFEMYVMLGAWIECQDAWTSSANHEFGNTINNTAEIETAIEMANTYPDIVKMIAVGNEAMVKWATSYYVQPNIILKWVNHLQALKKEKKLPADLWVTSSDNYESWGGGDKGYHSDILESLIKSVDFISLHTYPFHDSHYNPAFWGTPIEEEKLTQLEQVDAAMVRAKNYAISQYQGAVNYLKKLEIEKPIHIGETGWATVANINYGAAGSHAADEYKEKLYYQHMREWTREAGMSCFYFEAFNEKWKDAENPLGSENHFGLINLKSEAKYALWDLVDAGVFDGLTRGGKPITKSYNGNEKVLLTEVLTPPLKRKMAILEITNVNSNRSIGEVVSENKYIITNDNSEYLSKNNTSYPSEKLRLNSWEGTCNIKMSADSIVEMTTGTGDWWGAAIEIQAGGKGENLSGFLGGSLNFEIKGNTNSAFEIGFQTGSFIEGTQKNNFVIFGPQKNYSINENWKSFSIKISDLYKGGNLADVTGLIYFKGVDHFDGKAFYVRNVFYSKI